MKTNEEGKFIIKANEKDYVMVEQHVRKGKLCYSMSLSRCVTDATSFATKEDAQEIIDNLWLVYGDEVLTYKILDREVEKASADAEAERKRRNSNIRSWQKTSDDHKRRILRKLLIDRGEQGLKEWLEDVDDVNTTLTPVTDEELVEEIAEVVKNTFDIDLTQEQKEILLKKGQEDENYFNRYL